jgi:hypothetical protein
MEAIRDIQKRFCSRAMVVAIVLSIVFLVCGQKTLAKGLILGTLFSILNFIIMGQTLGLRVRPTRNHAFWVSLSSMTGRYLLLAIPVVMAIKLSQFHLVTVVIGLFMVQLMILTDRFMGTGLNHSK